MIFLKWLYYKIMCRIMNYRILRQRNKNEKLMAEQDRLRKLLNEDHK